MQIFIKLPEPYCKTFVFEIDLNLTFQELKNMINERTCYKDIQYYLISGTGLINEQYDNFTIREYNELFPKKKITDEYTINLHIRHTQ